MKDGRSDQAGSNGQSAAMGRRRVLVAPGVYPRAGPLAHQSDLPYRYPHSGSYTRDVGNAEGGSREAMGHNHRNYQNSRTGGCVVSGDGGIGGRGLQHYCSDCSQSPLLESALHVHADDSGDRDHRAHYRLHHKGSHRHRQKRLRPVRGSVGPPPPYIRLGKIRRWCGGSCWGRGHRKGNAEREATQKAAGAQTSELAKGVPVFEREPR